jgi:hypothetical protein
MRRRWRSTRRSKQAGHAVLDRWRPDSLRVLRARLPARCADAVQIEQCGALFTKDVFPDARLVHYCEWFYNAPPLDVIEGRVEIDRAEWPYADIGFDPEFPTTFDDLARIRSWNALHLLNLANCDVGISPTQWQKAQHPKEFLDKIVVAHEGIDTENLGPDPNAVIKTPSGEVLRANDPNKPVITYVARNLEPYRGFHTFMRALPASAAGAQERACVHRRRGRRELWLTAQGREELAGKDAGRGGSSTRSDADAFLWQGALRRLQAGAAGELGTCVPDLSLRTQLVLPGGDGHRGA